LLSKDYGGEAMKKQVFFSDFNGSKRARISESQMKAVLVTFLDMKVTVHFEFIPQG